MPLSVAIITHNPGSLLEACLRSVAFADDVVIVDTGSTDATPELASAHGARLIRHEWLGFGPQKQFAVEQARHDWVLCLDADERVSDRLRASIQDTLQSPQAGAYELARCNRFMGRWLRHGEGYPDWCIRLFDRRRARWSADPVHEKVLTDARPGRLAGDLLHESAESLERYLEKQNRYTSLQAEAMHAGGLKAGLSDLLLSPFLRFIKFYVLRLGFLDGVPGLVHVLIGCMNSFLKYAKLIALRRASRT